MGNGGGGSSRGTGSSGRKSGSAARKPSSGFESRLSEEGGGGSKVRAASNEKCDRNEHEGGVALTIEVVIYGALQALPNTKVGSRSPY